MPNVHTADACWADEDESHLAGNNVLLQVYFSYLYGDSGWFFLLFCFHHGHNAFVFVTQLRLARVNAKNPTKKTRF